MTAHIFTPVPSDLYRMPSVDAAAVLERLIDEACQIRFWHKFLAPRCNRRIRYLERRRASFAN